jgi:hypothetical protein
MTPSGETMKTGASHFFRRSFVLVAASILALVLTACTGRGGGQLPPSAGFTGAASFGFSFSCEDKGGINPPTGQLRIELSYTDKGSNPLGSPFGIHGIVDTIDPVLESMICIGKPQAPGGKLIFLGRYRLTSGSPSMFPSMCKTTSPSCRFEVIVQDNDRSRAPSMGDSFSIKLSNVTTLTSEFPDDPAIVPYARAGTLKSGNLTVD